MTVLQLLRDQFAYHNWAAQRSLDAARVCSDEEFCRDLGPGQASLRARMTHLSDAEGIWFARILDGQSPTARPDEHRFKHVAQIVEVWQAGERRRVALMETLSDEALLKPITYRNLAGKEFTSVLHEILQHLVLHHQYHRGQISGALRALGKQPPETDAIVFFRTRR